MSTGLLTGAHSSSILDAAHHPYAHRYQNPLQNVNHEEFDREIKIHGEIVRIHEGKAFGKVARQEWLPEPPRKLH